MRVPTGRLWVVEDPEPPASARADETPSPGRYLREQRLRRGMTLEEVAERTKIPRASVEALEDERFEALPGPVFVKGFLRCCARALEIDEQIVLDLLYEQERARLRADRGERADRADREGTAATRAAATKGGAGAAGRAAATAAVPAALSSLAEGSAEALAGAPVAPSPGDVAPPSPASAAPPPAPGSLRPSPRSFASGSSPARIGGARSSNADESAAEPRAAATLGRGAPILGSPSAVAPAILGRARDLLERAGAVASRVPGANFLLWIAVALLVLGVVFAVLMAIGAQRMLPPHS